MQINLAIVLAIIVIHWIADFIFQAEDWALNKSSKNIALLKHVGMYTFIWLWVGIIFSFSLQLYQYVEFNIKFVIFCIITFVLHFITDYFTSRVVKKRFDNKHFGSEIPNFGAFTIIGFDQILHYFQLFLTYYFLNFNL